MLRRPALSWLLALSLGPVSCRPPAPDNSELERRVAALEEQLGDLRERLAAVPDAEGLETAAPEELVLRLSAGDAVTRYRAIRELSRRGPQEVHQLLLEVISGGRGREREGAAAVFALESRPEVATELLRLHAEEKEPRVRALLALALGRSGGPQTAAALLKDLAHESRTVRLATVQALDRLGAAEAGGKLLLAAMDADVHVASAARGVLARLPEQSFQFIASEWEWLDPRERVEAIELIGTLGNARALRFLRERTGDASPLVGLSAALSLARQGDSTGRDLAARRLGSEDPVISRAAREVLDALAPTR